MISRELTASDLHSKLDAAHTNTETWDCDHFFNEAASPGEDMPFHVDLCLSLLGCLL